MNYQKIYNQIIERAKTRQIEGYIEKHHIIPRCIGGTNNKENIIQLTAREHFLCHQLLVELYPDEPKLKHALFLMSIGKQKNKNKQYKISSRTYERLKLEYALFLTGKKQSDSTRQKKSEIMKKVWAKKTDKEKRKIANKRKKTRDKKGYKQSEETKLKIKKSLTGRKITWEQKRNKFVLQYDLQNNFIKEYKSANQADREMGGKGQNVADCCNNKQKTAYGFKWKWK